MTYKEAWVIEVIFGPGPSRSKVWYLIYDDHDYKNGTSNTPRILYTESLEEATRWNTKEGCEEFVSTLYYNTNLALCPRKYSFVN